MVPVSTDRPDDTPDRRALVVAGMHRSGTSAMARTLSLLGASLPRHLMQAHDDNPAGFWESEKIFEFNDEILATLDSEWDDVFAFRPRPYLSNFDRVFAGRAGELLDQEFNDAELIVFKDPRVSVLTAFWERALRQAGYGTTYVIMVRNPLEVADSLRTRNNFPRDKSLLLWSSYMVAVERDTRGLSRVFVSYDDLLRDWRGVLTRIEQAAGVPFPRDTPAARNAIDAFVTGKLRHHVVTADDLAARADVPDYVKTLYSVFSAAAAGGDIDPAAVDQVQAELAKIETAVGSLVADLRDRARSLEKQAAEAAERLIAQEQALGIEQAAVQEAREALVQALDEKSSVESTLNQRIAELSEDLLQREQRLDEAASALAEQQQLAEELRARIGEGEQRAAVLKANIAEMASDLRKKDERIRQAEQALETTQHDKQAVESRLQDRFGELATITRMLAEAEERERQARAEADWLREAGAVLLTDANRRKGAGLLGLLPASLQAKRQRRLLKERGLFDEEAYLASNPDVAAEGADPLGHYVKHGIAEERRRG